MKNVEIIRHLDSAAVSIYKAIDELNRVDGYGSYKIELDLVATALAAEINALEELTSI